MGADTWEAIDLFWLCHERVPGFSGWNIQRQAYPQPGTPLEQDNWTIWAFDVLKMEYYSYQADTEDERKQAQELANMHAKVQQKR